METFPQYGHALVALILYALLIGVLNAMTGIRKGAQNMIPGQDFPNDYDDYGYRMDRAYMNAVENVGPFAAVTLAAILAGASPFLVNLMASLVLVFRVLYTVCYAAKIGGAYGSVRTILAVLSLIAIIVMAVAAILEVF